MHFCKDARPEVTEALKAQLGSEFKSTMVMKKMGEMWGKVKDTDQANLYKQRAQIDKEKYEETLARLGVVTKKTKPKSTRPKSGYMLYCSDERPAVTTKLKAAMGTAFRSTEVMRTLGAQWKLLSAAQRDTYNMKAAALKDGTPLPPTPKKKSGGIFAGLL